MEVTSSENADPKKKKPTYRNTGNGVYGLAFIGAVVYYIQHAVTFWMGVVGFFKALVWPAFLIYNLLEYLKM
jgi:hypothetical protein